MGLMVRVDYLTVETSDGWPHGEKIAVGGPLPATADAHEWVASVGVRRATAPYDSAIHSVESGPPDEVVQELLTALYEPTAERVALETLYETDANFRDKVEEGVQHHVADRLVDGFEARPDIRAIVAETIMPLYLRDHGKTKD